MDNQEDSHTTPDKVWQKREDKMNTKKGILIGVALFICMVVAIFCGAHDWSKDTPTKEAQVTTQETETEAEVEEPAAEEEPVEEEPAVEDEYEYEGAEPTSLQGKWTDEFGITSLVVKGNKAVLNDRCVGTADGTELDFPNDYKKVETELIDGKLYITITPFDWVLEQADLPKDTAMSTIVLTKE